VGVSSSIGSFTVPTRIEKQYYILESILGGRSSVTTAGPRISLDRANSGDGVFHTISATSLSGASVFNQGSKDATATSSMATIVAANTNVPIVQKGLLFNSTSTGTFRNILYVQNSGSATMTVASGSVFYQHFTGLSASLAPFTSSQSPLALISGTLDAIRGGDLITQSVLPPTASLWVTASLSSTVTNSSNTSWVTAFTLTGMTDGKRYLVNFFVRCGTAATTTGVWLRAASGSNYNGIIYMFDSANNNFPTVGTSSGSLIISNTFGTGRASIGPRIDFGEYTVTKAAGLNPTIEILSEVNASQVYMQSGSFVLWRALE
jgi:hypothetical protein